MSTEFAHKKILVLGAGVTGTSVARFLQASGAKVTLTDDNSENAVKPDQIDITLSDFECARKQRFGDCRLLFDKALGAHQGTQNTFDGVRVFAHRVTVPDQHERDDVQTRHGKHFRLGAELVGQ